MRWGLTGLLLEEVASCFDLLEEFAIVLEEALDIVMRQINKHASDLRSELGSLELCDEIKDGVSNLLFHVGVSGNNGRDKLESVSVEHLFRSLRLTHTTLRSNSTFRSGHSSTHDHTAVSFHRVSSHLVVVHVVAVLRSSSTVVAGMVAALSAHLLSWLHWSTIESTSLVLRKIL